MSKRSANSSTNSPKRSRNEEYGLPDPRLNESDVDSDSDIEIIYESNSSVIEGVPPSQITPMTNVEPQAGGSKVSESHERDGPAPFIEPIILREGYKNHKNLKTEKFNRLVEVKFNFTENKDNIFHFANELDEFYSDLCKDVVENPRKHPEKYSEEDFYWVSIKSKALKKALFFKPKKVKNFDRMEFTTSILKITQSNEGFVLREMEIEIFVCSTVTGKGIHRESSRKRAPEDVSETSRRKKCVITMKNKDNSCGYRALYVGFKYFEEEITDETGKIRPEKVPVWKKICAQNRGDTFQVQGTKQFIADVNTFTHNDQCQRIINEGSCDGVCISSNALIFEEAFGSKDYHFEVVNDYLITKGYNFVIVEASNAKGDCYQGPKETGEEKTIFIEWQKQAKHFNFIKDMRAYRETAYFCHSCYSSHWESNHECEDICSKCGAYPKCNGGEPVTCDVCNRAYVNAFCYDRHISTTNRNNQCVTRKFCEECRCTFKVEKKNPHKCGEYTCRNCRATYNEGPHYCWLKPLDLTKMQTEDSKNKFIVTFDIESTVVVQGDTNEDLHKANMLISETVWDKCWNHDTRSKEAPTQGNPPYMVCTECGIGKQVFLGQNCVNSFCDYLYKELAVKASKSKIDILVFAHNSKGYDGHFVMRDFFENREFRDPPNIILQGLKLLKFGVNNVSFIDSLSFFQQPLASVPKSFGFEEVVLKGFFPHKMNTFEYLSYRGPIPAKENFEPDFMKVSTRAAFDDWHDNFTGTYVLVKELQKYCANDVKILTIAVMEFRNRFGSVTDFDPITRSFTLASVAMEHFRSKVLKEEDIGITPIEGYFNTRNKSMEASIWLDFLQKVNGIQIRREVKIGPYYVDGFYSTDNSKEIFEYFGCPWHGCEQCFPEPDVRNRVNEGFLRGQTYIQLKSETNKKIKYFNDRGYKMTMIWGHEYKELKRNDSDLRTYHKIRKEYYKFVNENKNLNIREAFFGGRTNNICFNYICKDNEKIKYKDVTSLYPSVLVKNMYPKGHPIVLNEFESNDISQYFGFIRCRVMAPKNLFIPVLPYRNKDNKLLFPLCKSCADIQANECHHSDEERQLIGTWFSEELKLALNKGYEILEVIEVLDYPEKHDGHFKPYIQSWLKIKTESSGWPSHCSTQESKSEFIRKFEEKEGIELDSGNMVKNPGLRYISKLMLNSLWGKLGQRRNQSQTIIVSNFSEFYKLISDAKYDIKGILPVNDEKFLVDYKFSDEKYDKAGNTSIAIAAMVTGYARIKLYSIIDAIESSNQGRVLYFDTDSVIYVDEEGKNWFNPPDGDFLGDMTDEITKDYGPDCYIEKFASWGPKNYGYAVRTPEGLKFTSKIKGINITSGIKDVLDFDKIFEFANSYREGNRSEQVLVPQLQFRTTKEHHILTNKFDKQYRVVSDKRIVVPFGPIQTLPF